MKMTGKLFVSLVLLLCIGSVNGFGGFVPARRQAGQSSAVDYRTCARLLEKCRTTPTRSVKHTSNQKRKEMSLVSLYQSGDDNDQPSPLEENASNFDGEGFANYLAPYALAAVGSILITGLFVKFVLLDY